MKKLVIIVALLSAGAAQAANAPKPVMSESTIVKSTQSAWDNAGVALTAFFVLLVFLTTINAGGGGGGEDLVGYSPPT